MTDWLMTLDAGNAAISTNATYYAPISGAWNFNTSEAETKNRVRDTYTWKNLYIEVSSNTATATSTFRTRKNGANGGQSVSIGAGATGTFEDTSNTDSLTTGDQINMQLVVGSGGSIMAAICMSTLLSHAANVTIQAGAGTGNFAANDFGVLGGYIKSPVATEASNQVTWRTNTTLSRFTAYVTANSATGTTTLKVRKNGSDGSQVLSITAGATGEFEDTSNTDSISAGDEVCWQRTGSNNTLTIRLVQCESDGVLRFICLYGVAASADRYMHLNGQITNSASASNNRTKTRVAAVFKNLFAYVSANTRTVTGSVNLRGAGTNKITISLTALTTGIFEETSTSYTAGTTDLVDFQYDDAGGSGSVTIPLISVEQIPSAATPATLVLGAIAGIAAVTNLVVGTPSINLGTIAGVSSLANLAVATPAPIVPSTVAAVATVSNLTVGTPLVTLQAIAALAAVQNLALSTPGYLTPSTIAALSALSNLVVSSPTLLALGSIAGVAGVSNLVVGTPLMTLQTIDAVAVVSALVESPGAAELILSTIAGLAVVSNLVVATPARLALGTIATLSELANLIVGTPLLTLQQIAAVSSVEELDLYAPSLFALSAITGLSSVGNLALSAPASLELQAIAGVALISAVLASPAGLTLQQITALSSIAMILSAGLPSEIIHVTDTIYGRRTNPVLTGRRRADTLIGRRSPDSLTGRA